jgi:hypothetical protein
MTGEKIEYSFASVSDAQWTALSKTRIFFGHQSVGNDILGGARDILRAEDKIHITIQDEKSSGNGAKGVILHGAIGENEAPETKISSFSKKLTPEKNIDIALMKFCYIDINAQTDVEALFAHYKDEMKNIQKKIPGIHLVHVTVPLTSSYPGWKTAVKRILGRRDAGLDANKRRNYYNSLLVREFAGKAPIFDLATLESTTPDGKRASFEYEGEQVFYLSPSYTSDGGHLNEIGRRKVANEFLAFLAKLAGDR